MRRRAQRAKCIAARFYSLVLIVWIIALFDAVTAVMLFCGLIAAKFVYAFFKHVVFMGLLNEDLRELNN